MKITGVYCGGIDDASLRLADEASKNLGLKLMGHGSFLEKITEEPYYNHEKTGESIIEISSWRGLKNVLKPFKAIRTKERHEVSAFSGRGEVMDLAWEKPYSTSYVRVMRVCSEWDRNIERFLNINKGKGIELVEFGRGYNLSMMETMWPGTLDKMLDVYERVPRIRFVHYAYGPMYMLDKLFEMGGYPDVEISLELRVMPQKILDELSPGYSAKEQQIIEEAAGRGIPVHVSLYPTILHSMSSETTMMYRSMIGKMKDAIDSDSISGFSVHAMPIEDACRAHAIVKARRESPMFNEFMRAVYDSKNGTSVQERVYTMIVKTGEEVIGSFYDGPIDFYYGDKKINACRCKEGKCRQ